MIIMFVFLVQEVESLGKNVDRKVLEKENEEFLSLNQNSLEHVNEYIKLRTKVFEDKDSGKLQSVAVTALKNENEQNGKIYLAISIHKRLLKVGSDGKEFRELAQKLFPYAVYF